MIQFRDRSLDSYRLPSMGSVPSAGPQELGGGGCSLPPMFLKFNLVHHLAPLVFCSSISDGPSNNSDLPKTLFSILMPINLVPNFTHRGRLVIRGHCCSFDQFLWPLGYRQTVISGRWWWLVQTALIFGRHLFGKFGIKNYHGHLVF